jgi:CDP-glycerol glycerophosphotransferase (TagB/SpsB family)
MFKNKGLKIFLKKTIFPCLTLVNKLLPKDDKVILLYTANNGVSFCNLTMRKYLLEHNYDKKYKIYCGIEKMIYAENIPRVTFVSGMRSVLVFLKSAHVFYTVGQIPIKPSRKQCVIQMQHGNADFKRMANSTNIGNGDEFFFTYMISPSDFYVKIHAKAYLCSESNIVVAGDPMCDDLLTAPRNSYDFSRFKKVLFWVPTYRQSEYLGYDDSHIETLVPLFREEDYGELNNILEKYNIHLIVKLHPVQTAPEGARRHFSHLSVFSHQEFEKSEYDMYTLMAQSDGLIGDYSSASMQYLLLDRPLAFVVPDIEDYAKTRGFIFKQPEDYMGGHIIKAKEDFYAFIDDFANDRDLYREKRHRVCNQIYKYHDANSCERIVKLSGLSLE